MMRKLSVLASALFAFGTPTIVLADDWTGFYAGVHGGYSDGEVSALGVSFSDEAFAYGFQVGYNYQTTNNWVFGGELSYGTAEYSLAGFSEDFDTIRAKFKAGYAMGTTMAYGIIGYANIDDGDDNADGITFGLGLGYKATDNTILTFELLRDDTDVNIGGFDVDVEQTSLLIGASYKF